MSIGYFIGIIASLFLLEVSLLPGIFTSEISLHISLLLLLAFIYQAWHDWMVSFLIFVLAMPFFTTEASIWLFAIYLIHILLAYLLTQSILGARSSSSYILYTLIIASTLSFSHMILFHMPIANFVGHFIFSTLFMLMAKALFPIRQKTFLSSV